MTVIPAYGRDYKSAKAAREDWANGKDFVIADLFSGDDGRYINIQDCKAGQRIGIRYKSLTQQVFVVVK